MSGAKQMINKLSRRVFQSVIGDRTKRRAIAFAIYMKDAKPASVIKDGTDEELARITNLDPRTCKKYIDLLHKMRLLSKKSKNGHDYLVFKPLREGKKKNRWKAGYHTPKHQDVLQGNYDNSSIRTIEIHLQALFICEVQRRKDYVQQNISTKQDPRSLREYKKALKICRVRGWNSFFDDGISYEYIRRALHCSPNTVSEIIRYGETAGLFTVTRYDPEVVYFGVDQAREAVDYLDVKWSWSTDDVVILQRANTFTLAENKNKDKNKNKNKKALGIPRVRRCRNR